MNRLSDIISRIFSTDQTQGLSGGAEVVIDRDPASGFYASRLRKHRTDEDLVEAPTWVWATVSYNGRKGGLRSHVHAERGDGVASFTDVLIVLNQVDARRAAQVEGEPWTERAARAISERFTQYCLKERFELLYGTRPLRFWFVADGGQDMLGHSFGLGPGEFITGLLPNLYVGPAPRSRPVLAVHLNLPGAWEGYREVGRLYSDQILYTLGRHWLDNFHNPKLREPGLYRLQQFPDGSLVHVISPELQDRYFVRSDALEGGASVLTIAERNGTPVAYLVLAVVETPAVVEPGQTVGVPLAAALRSVGLEPSAVEVEDDGANDVMSAPAGLQAAPPAGAPDPNPFRRDQNLQRTIIPDAVDTRMLTLHERGALLQRVHFANFMEGYDVYVGTGGRIATQMSSPRATLQVRSGKVSLLVGSDPMRVDGRSVPAHALLPLSGSVSLEVDGHTLQYRDLTDIRIEGWPYLGELRRPGAGTYLDFGGAFRVGRDRRCQVRLPDEPHNENIAWLPQVGTGTTIRSRTGDIPKSRFYTDSIMVASEHAELDLANEPVLRSLARHCYTYVRRDDQILVLAPREAAEGRHELDLRPNDEVLVGNCLFQVAYPPAGGTAVATPPRAPEMPKAAPPPPLRPPSAQELASLVDLPTTHMEPSEMPVIAPLPAPLPPAPVPPAPVPPAPARIGKEIKRFNTVDPVVAAGLGEAGPAPRAPGSEGSAPAARGPAPRPPVGDAPSGMRGQTMEVPSSSLALPRADDRPARPEPPAPPVPHGPARLGMADASAPPAPLHNAVPLGPARSDPGSVGFFARPATPAAPEAPRRTLDPTRPAPPMLLDDDHRPEPDLPLFEEVEGFDTGEPVLAVEEARWKLELARPARLLQTGWMISGEVTIGNHGGAQVIVPEVRAFKEQAFMTLDYFKVSVRGRKGKVEVLQEGEAALHVGGEARPNTDDLPNARLTIVRRDEHLEPDFDITLTIVRDEALPDPRAQLIAIDAEERLVAALFTLGFPARANRRIRLGRIVATYRWDGLRLRVSDYLSTYRGETGFLPFFVRQGDRPWQTFPEDGAPVELAPGDGLILGNAVYRFQAG